MHYRLKSDSKIEAKAVAGTLVFPSKGYDYGLARDDTRFTGVQHVSVTLDPEGGYPFFTHPLSDLEVIDG